MRVELIKKENISDVQRRRCIDLMDPKRRAAVERITHQGVRESTVCGEWLAKRMLSELSGMPVEEIRLARDHNGKPYVQNLPLYFSVSHSGESVACAVSERPVGLDIEEKRERDVGVARRICSQKELDYVFSQHKGSDPLCKIYTRGQTPCVDEKERLRRFLRVWTAKEAFVKLTGEGIKGMKDADFFELLARLKVQETEDCILTVIEKE